MDSFQNIIFTNERILNEKIESFNKSYSQNKKEESQKDKIIFVTDFDFTMTEKFDYNTGQKFFSSYEMFNLEIIGGNHQEYTQKREKIKKKYIIYEEDVTIDESIRKEKIKEWNELIISLMCQQPNLTRKSINEMVIKNKNNLKFRKGLKEFFEKLIEMNIPIIIVSGGIKEIIEDCLNLLNIKGLQEYIKRKRLFIIANEFVFDEKSKKCIGSKEIFYSYIKPEGVKKIVQENFQNIEKAFVLGDYVVDYSSISKLGLDLNKNIIGIGFINFSIDEVKKGININNNKIISNYQKVFDVNLIINEGYDYLIKLINKFN